MATKALTPVALRASRAEVSIKAIHGPSQGWRKLFKSQDAGLIWQELFSLIRSEVQNEQQAAQATQEVFLVLLTTNRIAEYIERKFSDRQVIEDILSLLRKE